MEKMLITTREVAELAFGRADTPSREIITDADIISAQMRYVKPVLGPLYDALLEGKYQQLLDSRVKLPLALYVKAAVLRSSAVHIGSMGVIKTKGDNFHPAGDNALLYAVRCIRSDARCLLRDAVEYIESHADDFPEYDESGNIWNSTSVAGDIVL